MSSFQDFVIENGALKKYTGSEDEIIIPDDVMEIRADAFSDHRKLINFTSITIPAGVVSIDERVFMWKSTLERINVDPNNTVYASKDGVLFNKDFTKLIYCPQTKRGEYMIPNTVTEIGTYAFYHCEKLKRITIPESVTEIGEYSFYWCTILTEITIPRSVTKIGSSAFSLCPYFKSISVDTENAVYTSKDDVLFNKDFTKLIFCPPRKRGEYIIPDSVTEIGEHAFFDCKISGVVIPDGITNILRSTFRKCINLKSVTIPNSVKEIGSNVFSFCETLTSVTIPDSVVRIGEEAFLGCKRLTINTTPGSYAEQYAKANDIPCIAE